MKKLRSIKWLGIPLVAIFTAILAVGVVAASIPIFYNLNSTIPATITVTAPTVTYDLTVNATLGGAATGSVNDVASGTTSNITATANPGYHFTGWTGDYVGTDSPHLVTITSDMTVTANFTADTLANLYTDLNCTVPVTTLDFGSVLTTGSPVTKIVYFKASSSNLNPQPAGYGFGEINPLTINVTSDIIPAVATLSYIVGEPFGAVINGNHPCMVMLTVTPIGAGTSSFNIVVTGNGP